MTTPPPATYEQTRQRHVAHAMAQMGPQIARLDWTREQIDAERLRGLRALTAAARARSPWHAHRLRDVDATTLTVDALRALPVMTKDDLMAAWDEIVTDRRVTLPDAEAHMAALTTDGYMLDEYHVVASGGSSGRRGVFAWDWDGWSLVYLGFIRWMARASMKLGLAPDRQVRAIVAAEMPTHMTSSVTQTFSNDMVPIHRFPVTLPVADIVAGLNTVQPTMLSGYPSILAELVREARAGTLTIAPKMITASSEPLTPDVRAALLETWDAPVVNWWGTSEAGATGASCGFATGMHLSDDMHILELVDDGYEPVPPGELASRVLVTNLINPLLPLIRYEITDEVRMLPEPCPCGSAFARVDDIQGRTDDCFRYDGGVVVHPHVFRSPLGRDARVLEYQVRQTPAGAEVDVRCSADADLAALQREIAEDLARVGLPSPVVRLRRVGAIPRTAAGKLARFIPQR